jgi:hypothetical protein
MVAGLPSSAAQGGSHVSLILDRSSELGRIGDVSGWWNSRAHRGVLDHV